MRHWVGLEVIHVLIHFKTSLWVLASCTKELKYTYNAFFMLCILVHYIFSFNGNPVSQSVGQRETGTNPSWLWYILDRVQHIYSPMGKLEQGQVFLCTVNGGQLSDWHSYPRCIPPHSQNSQDRLQFHHSFEKAKTLPENDCCCQQTFNWSRCSLGCKHFWVTVWSKLVHILSRTQKLSCTIFLWVAPPSVLRVVLVRALCRRFCLARKFHYGSGLFHIFFFFFWKKKVEWSTIGKQEKKQVSLAG